MDEKELCIQETKKHIDLVGDLIVKLINELDKRIFFHDYSKLNEPEIEGFIKYTPKLKNCTYGSEEYKQYLKELKPYLDHHYQNNRHHPEHFENGISNMNLVDLIEMFCDWFAATKRHNDGDIYKSIDINKNRFGYDDILTNIFKNTVQLLENKNE